MALTPDEVRHIARLARLHLSPEEEQRYAVQLSAILDYAARLTDVDTTAVPPTAGVQTAEATPRPDLPRPSPARDRILANAPAAAGGMFLVPPILDA